MFRGTYSTSYEPFGTSLTRVLHGGPHESSLPRAGPLLGDPGSHSRLTRAVVVHEEPGNAARWVDDPASGARGVRLETQRPAEWIAISDREYMAIMASRQGRSLSSLLHSTGSSGRESSSLKSAGQRGPPRHIVHERVTGLSDRMGGSTEDRCEQPDFEAFSVGACEGSEELDLDGKDDGCMKQGVKGKRGKGGFMGVTKHKNSGRYEARIWVSEYGKQIYLGGFKSPVAAAIAHDIVAKKIRSGPHTTNFPSKLYSGSMNWIKSSALPEIIAHIKRQSKSFTRGLSRFRGVSKNAHGNWEARAGLKANRHLFLGVYRNEEAAGRHYDRAMVRLKGDSITTNFPMVNYQDEVKEHEEFKKAMLEGNFLKDKQFQLWVKGGREGKRNGVRGPPKY